MRYFGVQKKADPRKWYLDDINEVKEIIGVGESTPSELIRKTVEFVHDNSIHRIDKEWREYALNIPTVVNKLLSAHRGDKSEKPHLSCGPRSYAVMAILKRVDIYSRIVHIYSDKYKDVESHRVLEVLNPTTQSWEVWDPDFRVTYVDRSTGTPVTIKDLVFEDKNNFVPKNGSIVGWKETNTEHLRENYFKAALFESDAGMKGSPIILNPATFDLNKRFSDGLTFREWTTKHCGHSRFIMPMRIKEQEFGIQRKPILKQPPKPNENVYKYLK